MSPTSTPCFAADPSRTIRVLVSGRIYAMCDCQKAQQCYRRLSAAGITLRVANLTGRNCHHIAETCFKAVARCLRKAIEADPRQSGRVPSTKGQLGG